jgi:hypothetical protein
MGLADGMLSRDDPYRILSCGEPFCHDPVILVPVRKNDRLLFHQARLGAWRKRASIPTHPTTKVKVQNGMDIAVIDANGGTSPLTNIIAGYNQCQWITPKGRVHHVLDLVFGRIGSEIQRDVLLDISHRATAPREVRDVTDICLSALSRRNIVVDLGRKTP